LISSLPNCLVNELNNIPPSWALTPILDKSPLRPDWQTERVIPRQTLANLLRDGQKLWSHKRRKYWHCRWTGYGLLTGDRSGGLVAIDIDGATAEPLLQLLSGSELPLTVSWTSGKPGKRQLVYQLPEVAQEQLHDFNRAVLNEWQDYHTRSGEILEFRYNRCQSALPPSKHPETGSYHWIQAPVDVPVAIAPEWLCKLLVQLAEKERLAEQARQLTLSTKPVGDENPWDIRNFAPYLEGYNPGGRRKGWTTCKCPAHDGVSDNSLHIEETTGAFKCHAGCTSKDAYRAAKEAAISAGYQLLKGELPASPSWLHGLKHRLKKNRKSPWGFAQVGQIKPELKPHGSEETSKVIEYRPGKRLEVWANAVQQGYRHILDISATGTGKSFDAGIATSKSFNAAKLVYLSDQHRNPTTETLRPWTDLEARHKGLSKESTPNGQTRYRRAKREEVRVISANCGRIEALNVLRSKNIAGADTAGVVCGTCPYLEACRSGHLFGYLHQRAEALKSSRLRAHPDSLPDPAEFEFNSTVLFWEEAGQNFKSTREVAVEQQDVTRAIADLAVQYPGQFPLLSPILGKLRDVLSGEIKQPNKFGWNHAQVLAMMSAVPDFDRAVIAQLQSFDQSILNTTGEYGVDLEDLPAGVRKRFSDRDHVTAERVERDVPKQWLIEFLDTLAGDLGHLRIVNGLLTLTLPEYRHRQVAHQAKANIFLDATLTCEELALKLNCHSSEILVVCQTVPDLKNSELIQVATMGRMGVHRGKEQQRRLEKLVAHLQQEDPKAKLIDFKCFVEDDDGKGKWWVDSRGSNDFENSSTLILVGTPCRNLASLEAEFTVLSGRLPTEGTEMVRYSIQVNNPLPEGVQPFFEMEDSADQRFREFIRRKILADIHQAIGRLRSHRRPGEKLKVYFVADYPLDIPVMLKQASEITPEAATKTERLEIAIKQAVADLKAKGLKITQQAIAAITGYSQQYISRCFKQFRDLLLLLYERSNSKSSKNSDPPPDVGEVERAAAGVLSEIADHSYQVVLKSADEVFFTWLQSHQWQQVWQLLTAEVQIKLLQSLVLTLPPADLRQLYHSVGDRL